MATLTRSKSGTRISTTPISNSQIPAPFPREQFLQTQQNETLTHEDQPQAGPSHTSEVDDVHHIAAHGMLVS